MSVRSRGRAPSVIRQTALVVAGSRRSTVIIMETALCLISRAYTSQEGLLLPAAASYPAGDDEVAI